MAILPFYAFSTMVFLPLLRAEVRQMAADSLEKMIRGAVPLARKIFRDPKKRRLIPQLVEALLSNPALKLDAVAHSLGFGDQAAFSKAFRRLIGMPPGAYARRHMRGPDGASAQQPDGRRR